MKKIVIVLAIFIASCTPEEKCTCLQDFSVYDNSESEFYSEDCICVEDLPPGTVGE